MITITIRQKINLKRSIVFLNLILIKELDIYHLRDPCTCRILLKHFMFVFIRSNKNEHEMNKKQQNN